MIVEESWRELLEKMWVSKTVKKYILSIEQETKEYFEQSVALIEKRVKEEVFKTPLISSSSLIMSIIEQEMKLFMENVIALIDYYVDGIYNSGKLVSRNKLKLQKLAPESGERYNFTQNDKNFIERYKSIKLNSFGSKLMSSVNSYLNHLIKDKYKIFNYSQQEMVDDEIKDIVDIVNESLVSIYDEFIEYNACEILNLFKRAQVEEYRNLGIDVVTYFSDDDSLSCPVCTAKSGKIVKLNDAVDDFGIKDGINHAFCKYSIDPVINYQNQLTHTNYLGDISQHSEYEGFVDGDIGIDKDINKRIDFDLYGLKFINAPIEIEYRINRLMTKLKINFNNLITSTTIEFVDNITSLEEWVNSVQAFYMEKGKNEFEALNEALRAQDNLKYKVSVFSTKDVIYISPRSLDSQPIENMIVREFLKSKIEVDDWITNRFNEKKESKETGFGAAVYKDPFVSYLAEESPQNYLVESAVCYINLPNKLEVIDKDMFDYIKQTVLAKNIQEESIENDK